jgi:hypothetical protein
MYFYGLSLAIVYRHSYNNRRGGGNAIRKNEDYRRFSGGFTGSMKYNYFHEGNNSAKGNIENW